MRMFRKDEGFTLVELMVVVLIIGILVAIAIPVFNSASESARTRTCQANLRTLDGAVQQWKSALASNVVVAGDDAAAMNARLVPAYIKTIPACPSGGANAAYTFAAASEDYACEVAGHDYTP